MNAPVEGPGDLDKLSREELMSALFAELVIQQTNMALMLLGKAPHPETGEHIQDLSAARLFIEQLEMLAVKTRGNLNQQENHLLQQSLMAVRMSFVEMVDKAPASNSAARSETAPASIPSETAPKPSNPPAEQTPPSVITNAEESGQPGKRFSKKY